MFWYYVVLAGRPNRKDTEICSIRSTGPGPAHIFAANEYRKKHQLATSVHITTSTLFDSESPDECEKFIERLVKEMEKDAAKRSSEQHPENDQG